MPSGQVHYDVWKKILVVIAPTMIILSAFDMFFLYVLFGYLHGYIMSPDLDQVGITSDEGRALKIPVFGVLWVMYWFPYGKFFSHRGISHYPVVGTITRFVYLYWWTIIVPVNKIVLAGIFIGILIHDISHIVLDNLYSTKNFLRRKKNGKKTN